MKLYEELYPVVEVISGSDMQRGQFRVVLFHEPFPSGRLRCPVHDQFDRLRVALFCRLRFKVDFVIHMGEEVRHRAASFVCPGVER